MNTDILLPHIRAVTSKDKNLPKFSYSKIEQFLNCPMAYNFKYNENKTSNDTSLALELGSLLHKVLEEKGKKLKNGEVIDYSMLDKLIESGTIEETEKTKDKILGVDALKKKYWEIWSEPDSEGRTYDDKLNIFDKITRTEMEDDDWIPIEFEKSFQIVWDDKYILHGFIDRVDIKNGEYRVIDYKTSKKIFDEKKLPTSLQFGIYALACLVEYEKLPVAYRYRFILLDKFQNAMTIGWEKRLVDKLNKVFKAIEAMEINHKWQPRPCPLCYYCSYSETNPNATIYRNNCEYHSLWTPTNKIYDKKKDWDPEQKVTEKRKIIF